MSIYWNKFADIDLRIHIYLAVTKMFKPLWGAALFLNFTISVSFSVFLAHHSSFSLTF